MRYLIVLIVLLAGCAQEVSSKSALIYPGDVYMFTEKGVYLTEGRMFDVCRELWFWNYKE